MRAASGCSRAEGDPTVRQHAGAILPDHVKVCRGAEPGADNQGVALEDGRTETALDRRNPSRVTEGRVSHHNRAGPPQGRETVNRTGAEAGLPGNGFVLVQGVVVTRDARIRRRKTSGDIDAMGAIGRAGRRRALRVRWQRAQHPAWLEALLAHDKKRARGSQDPTAAHVPFELAADQKATLLLCHRGERHRRNDDFPGPHRSREGNRMVEVEEPDPVSANKRVLHEGNQAVPQQPCMKGRRRHGLRPMVGHRVVSKHACEDPELLGVNHNWRKDLGRGHRAFKVRT